MCSSDLSPTSTAAMGVEDLTQTTRGINGESHDDEKGDTAVRKFRGIPESVKLFEVFWQQVVELIKVRVRSCA